MVQGAEGSGGGGRALVLFGFGSVWLRDLSMQLCFGFASDVFAVCKAAHLLNFYRRTYDLASPGVLDLGLWR